MTKEQQEQRRKQWHELLPKLRNDQRKKAEGAARARRIVIV